MRAELVAPRAAPAVALDEAKLFLRVDGADEDALVEGLVEAATDLIEKETGHLIGPQGWKITATGFSALVRLPVSPVLSITEIEATGPDGISAVVPAATYQLHRYAWGDAVVVAQGQVWPTLGRFVPAVEVSVAAGFDPVPAPLRTAIKLLAATWYQHRDAAVGPEAAQALPYGVKSIVDRYRRFR